MESTGRGRTKRSPRPSNCRSYKRDIAFVLITALTTSLAGCASVEPTYTIEVTPPKRPVLQQNLASPCPDLSKLTKPCYNQGEVVDLLTEWISLYEKCRYKHAETVRFIEDYLQGLPRK